VPNQLTSATFIPHVGEAFRLDFDDFPTVELKLTAVDEYAPNPGADREEPFSLFFRGPQEPVLPQAIYRFEHDALGSLEIFVVPIGRDDSGTSYEAVFN
jgi:hypothetical protein